MGVPHLQKGGEGILVLMPLWILRIGSVIWAWVLRAVAALGHRRANRTSNEACRASEWDAMPKVNKRSAALAWSGEDFDRPP